MTKILIVDDNPSKIARTIAAICRVPGMGEQNIDHCDNLVSARDHLVTSRYDLLILDLRIPNRSGDNPEDIGDDFIREINISRTLLKPFHIIGLTAYDDVLSKADPVFMQEVWRIIRFDAQSIDWENQLISKISYLVASKQDLADSRATAYLTDIAIVTALRKPELEAVLALPAQWVETRYPNDSTIYYLGTFQDSKKKLRVVAASAPQMGMPAASALSMKVITRFRPRFLTMVGIAAGIRGAVNIGDVVVADQCWDYGSGKRRVVDGKSVLLPDFKSIPLSQDIKERLQHLQAEGTLASNIEAKWQKAWPSTDRLRLLIGPVASGAAVVQDVSLLEEIQAHSRKLTAIDMEAYAIAYAAESCTKPRPTALIIKSICDYADDVKNDDWQAYAAFTSANLLLDYCLREVEPLSMHDSP